MNDFIPLEETDPLIADLFMDVVNKRYNKYNVKSITLYKNSIGLTPYKNYDTVGPYDLCPCKSGKKHKFCHCMDLFKS